MAARLPYLDRAQVGPEVQSVFDTLQRASGRVLNFYRLMAHHARSVAPFLAWYPQLREGSLDPKLRYLAYVRASSCSRLTPTRSPTSRGARSSRTSSGWCSGTRRR